MSTPDTDGPRAPEPGRPADLADTVALAVDGSGRVTAWSPRAERLFGLPAGEALGLAATELFEPPAPSALPAAPGWSGRVRGRHRDGRTLDLAVRATPLDGAGTAPLTVLSVIDLGRAPWWTVSQSVLERFLTHIPYGIAILDDNLRYTWLNRTLEDMAGVPMADRLGRRVRDVLPDLQPEAMEAQLRHALDTGEPVVGFEYHGHTPADRERDRVYATSFFRLDDADGRILGVCYMGTDVTERRRAQERLTLLTESGMRIGTTLSLSRTAEELTEVGVPALADFISVDLFADVLVGEEPTDPAGRVPSLVRVAHHSRRQGTPEAAVAIGEASGFAPDSPVTRCVTDGIPVFLPSIGADEGGWPTGELVRAERVRAFGLRSVMAVPILVRGTCLGVVVLLRGGESERFEAADLPLATEFVSRAAMSLDNARRYTRERLASVTLQRSLLPKGLSGETAMEVATRYRPASTTGGAGGDWFDVIPLSGARVALVVGDVVGHGLAAAAAMGRLRMAVRTLSGMDLPPEELLAHLDDLVLRLIDEEARADLPEEGGERVDERVSAATAVLGATCLYAVYDPADGSCVLARAGHPAPCLVDPDGTVRFADLPGGPPLGLGSLPFESLRTEVLQGGLIALFTDGLLTGTDDVEIGLERLRRTLSRPARPLETLCDDTLAALLDRAPRDDVALLLARAHALGPDQLASWDLPADPAVVRDARLLAVRTLSAWGLEHLEFTTELVVSELVTNAIRYGGAPIRLRLIRSGSLTCEVSDGSSTSPRLRHARLTDEGGRGLFMVAQMTHRWGTRHTEHGKTIWTEQPLAPPLL